MHTTSINFTILSALRSAESVERAPSLSLHNMPRFVKSIFGYFAMPRLQKVSFSLADACRKLQTLTLDIQRSNDVDVIDPNLVQRDSLEKTKKLLLAQRAELRASHAVLDPDGLAMPKLSAEVNAIISLLGELYEIATELQWAIAEHDASNSDREEGFVASNVTELEAMLERISSRT